MKKIAFVIVVLFSSCKAENAAEMHAKLIARQKGVIVKCVRERTVIGCENTTDDIATCTVIGTNEQWYCTDNQCANMQPVK